MFFHALIITGADKNRRETKAKQIARKSQVKISSPDFKRLVADKNALGIDAVRQLQQWLGKKPYQSPKKIAVITAAEKLTIQAQNALLKTLEEPPQNSQIILMTYNMYRLLPTILSRCQTISLNSQNQVPSKDSEKDLAYFCHLPVEQKISCAQRMGKKKEELNHWLEKQKKLYRAKTKRGEEKAYQIVTLIESAQNMIQHHVSARLALEYIMLKYNGSTEQKAKQAE